MTRQAVLLATVLVVTLAASMVGCAGEVAPTPTAVPTPSPGAEVYEDPRRLFSVPIPTNWKAETADGYGVLTSPEGNLTVYVVALEANTVANGTRAAWALVDPSFNVEPDEVIQEPVTNGADESVTITYDTKDPNQVVLGGGWLYQGIAYLLLLRGDLVTFQKRVSQLSIISSGFNIYALEKVDLSNVAPEALDNDLLAELETYIREAMEYCDVPGAAVAIVKDGKIFYAKGFGVRRIGGNETVTPETLMLIGSTTKTMTTMLMAELVDEGLMAWDTRVVDILPTFAVADANITQRMEVQHLVCACTGVPRRDFEMVFNSEGLTAEDIVESLATFEFFTDFGEAFQYSNQMVATGGYVAALAAGGTYGNLHDDYVALMQKRVFDPIGMCSTTFSFAEAEAAGNCASPNGRDLALQNRPIPVSEEQELLEPLAPAGGAWSNVVDMGRYLITELNEGVAPDGRRVVSAENLGKTWEPQVAISDEASYGLGWIVDEYKGLRVFHHGGNTMGFTSDLAFVPEAGLGISVLTNQYGSLLNQLVRFRLLELMYRQKPEADELGRFQLGLIKKATDEALAKIQGSIDAAAVAPYLGRYRNDALGEVTVEWRGNKLVFDAGEFQSEIRSSVDEEGKVSYLLYESLLAGLTIEFAWAEAGKPTMTVGEGVNRYTFQKTQ